MKIKKKITKNVCSFLFFSFLFSFFFLFFSLLFSSLFFSFLFFSGERKGPRGTWCPSMLMCSSQNSRQLPGYWFLWFWSSLGVDSSSRQSRRVTIRESAGAEVSSEAGLGEGLLSDAVLVVPFGSLGVPGRASPPLASLPWPGGPRAAERGGRTQGTDTPTAPTQSPSTARHTASPSKKTGPRVQSKSHPQSQELSKNIDVKPPVWGSLLRQCRFVE